MRPLACLLVLLAACATQPAQQTVSTPPPPDRPENVATAFGIIKDPAGKPLQHARIRAWEADGHCDAIGGPITRTSGSDGAYEVTVGRSVGPEFEGCIVLEFAAGGSVAFLPRNAHFARDSRLKIDVTLPPARLLNRAEADRLMQVVRGAMHEGSPAAAEELALYTQDDITPHRRNLRGITDVRLLSEGDRRFEYELVGMRPGTSVRVTIAQDSLTRITFT
jgi:hypothetical protein